MQHMLDNTRALQEVVESSTVRLENGVPHSATHPAPSYGGPAHLFPHAPHAAMGAAMGGPVQHHLQQQQMQQPPAQHEVPRVGLGNRSEDSVEVEKSNMVMLVRNSSAAGSITIVK